MIGQKELLHRVQNFTYETYPQASLFVGTFGCGKHLLVNIISDKFNAVSKDITFNINNDVLLDLYTTNIPYIYIIDIDKASTSKKVEILQNSILKFVEEPPNNCKIILLCQNQSQILPTILNRCQVFSFEKYSSNELIEFSQEHSIDINEEDFDIYNTPGKILTTVNSKFNICLLKELVNNIIDNISKANPSNILTIVDKFDFSNDEFILSEFIHYMKIALTKRLMYDENFDQLKKYYNITLDFSIHSHLLGINKKLLFENYLLKMKMVTE